MTTKWEEDYDREYQHKAERINRVLDFWRGVAVSGWVIIIISIILGLASIVAEGEAYHIALQAQYGSWAVVLLILRVLLWTVPGVAFVFFGVAMWEWFGERSNG